MKREKSLGFRESDKHYGERREMPEAPTLLHLEVRWRVQRARVMDRRLAAACKIWPFRAAMGSLLSWVDTRQATRGLSSDFLIS